MRHHSKDTEISWDGQDISTHCNTSTMTRGAGTEELTTYGKDDEVHGGTLRNGKFAVGGWYETKATATSPKAVIQPSVGETVEIIRKPEGTGTGKPLETFSLVVTSYVETAPVKNYIQWSAEGTVSDAIADTNQA